MRTLFAIMIASIAGTATIDTAQADPYRWCANYGGSEMGGGGSNCYMLTLEQCRAAISGMGGFCEPNQFYDGRPVTTPGSVAQPRRRGSRG